MACPRLTPLKAIRRKCLDCCGGSAHEVRHCIVESCSLFAWRLGRTPQDRGKSSLKVIREKCLHDCGEHGSFSGVRDCPLTDCPLYAFRFGKNPNFSDATREKCRVRALKTLGGSKPHATSLSSGSSPLVGEKKQKRLSLHNGEVAQCP